MTAPLTLGPAALIVTIATAVTALFAVDDGCGFAFAVGCVIGLCGSLLLLVTLGTSAPPDDDSDEP